MMDTAERSACTIVNDLTAAGYALKEREGRAAGTSFSATFRPHDGPGANGR